MTPSVVHLIQCLSRGGASRALISAAGAVSRSGAAHRVVSLEAAAAEMATLARRHGLPVVERPDRRSLHRELERADIVHVHFWNTPELYAALSGPLPPTRLLLWCHVAGDHAPHVLTRELLTFADLTVASTPYTTDLTVFRGAPGHTAMIPPAGDWGRVRGVRPQPHERFNVGYIGTVDFAKMHPRYVSMSVRVQVPEARFVVCGRGDAFTTIARQAARLEASDRFELRGYVDDIRSVISQLDVFGYPLCEHNYSASELVLQEVMYSGVPPVVLANGGAQRSVLHGRTGLVVHDEDGYVRAIERLHAEPDERRRLGRGAREYALRAWDLHDAADRWAEAYELLLAEPKRNRNWPAPPDSPTARLAPAAARFVQSLGDTAPAFSISMEKSDEHRLQAAEERIAAAAPALASADSGGVLHWRRHYPHDPFLRLWAGLVLHGQGRPALAAGEFNAALQLGLAHPHASSYMARSIARAA